MKIVNLSFENNRNIPYLCTKYMNGIKEGIISRGFQCYPSEYGFPYDIIQQDPNESKIGDALRHSMLNDADIYILHEQFNLQPNIDRMTEDYDAKFISYLYDYDQTVNCVDQNKNLLDISSLIFIREPHLIYALNEWKDKVYYVPSPCSVASSDNIAGSSGIEYILPDDWIIVCHFGEDKTLYDVVNRLPTSIDDRRVAYFEIKDMKRPQLLSIIERFDLHVHSFNSHFYSQACIETIMKGIPTVTTVGDNLLEFVKDSPFIRGDPKNKFDFVCDVINELDEYRNDTIGNEFMRQHLPEQAVSNIMNIIHKEGLV